MSTLAVYYPTESLLHRLPAGFKLLVLFACAIGALFLDRPWLIVAALVGVVVLYAAGHIPWRIAWLQLRPVMWFIAALAVFQVLVNGWETALRVVGTMVALVMLAALVSLTTRTTEIVDVVVRVSGPLGRVGVDPERLGLLMALGIRSVPVVVDLAREVREAQLARGLAASPTAFAVPLVVRSLRHADRLGEALMARGVDD